MDELLERLRAAAGRSVSGAALAGALGRSRAAVHKRIQKLRALGHRIRGVNRLGYRLETEADVLDRSLFSPGWGRPFHLYARTGSTQEEAKARAAAGEKEGALFVAERQTAGRGRRGRRWESPEGGLWYSLLLRPPFAPSAVPGLALGAALDWAKLLRARGLSAQVKWPNDVWVEGKKVAGVLAEMSAEPDRVQWVALGVGLNVNNRPPKVARVPAASLAGLAGRPWSRADLLTGWMDLFHKTYRIYKEGGFPAIRKDYTRHSLLEGRRVAVEGVRGVVKGVDDAGALILQTPRGPVVVSAGDVSISL